MAAPGIRTGFQQQCRDVIPDGDQHALLTATLERLNKACNAARVRALDLRCGLALIIAGMCASGETEIADFHHAERGYEDVAGRLASLGARLRIEGT